MCNSQPKYKERYGCEGKKATAWVEIAGKTYLTCPLYPLTQDVKLRKLITEYNYFKLSNPTLSEVKAIPLEDLEMFDFIDNIISKEAQKKAKMVK